MIRGVKMAGIGGRFQRLSDIREFLPELLWILQYPVKLRQNSIEYTFSNFYKKLEPKNMMVTLDSNF